MDSQQEKNQQNRNSHWTDSSDSKATGRVHERELDDASKNKNPGELSSEKGDSGGENKVATSLENE
jgi:hypothetical protein